MAAVLMPEGKQSFETSSGAPLVGGKLYTYDAGTNTPRVTYQDAAGATPNANPVILDGRGEATIFWVGSYKVVLRDAADAVIWTVDNIVSTDVSAAANTLRADLAASSGSSIVGFIQAGTGAVARTEQSKDRELVTTFDYMTTAQIADVQAGTLLLDVSAAVQAAIDYLASLPAGGTLDPLPGKYRLGAQITLKPKVSIKSQMKGVSQGVGGASFGVTFYKYFQAGDLFYSPSTQTLEACEFEGFSIEGRKDQAGYTGCGIRILKANDCIFRRVWPWRNQSHGIQIGNINGQVGGSGDSFHNYFYNCYAFFNDGDGFYNCSDWMRYIDCWSDGNLSGINNAGGSFGFIERFHAEEFQNAAIYLSGSNGISGAQITIRDPIIFSRPYFTTWKAAAVWIGSGLAGNGTKIYNPKCKFEPTYSALTGQVPIFIDTVVDDVLIEDMVESGYAGAITHGTLTKMKFVRCAFFNPFSVTSSCGSLTLDGNDFQSTVSVAAQSISAIDNIGYGNNSDWTPVPQFGGAAVGLTQTSFARWTMHGKRVTLSLTMTFTAKGASAGTFTISGIPVQAMNGLFDIGVVQIDNSSGLTDFPVRCQVNSSDNKIRLFVGAASALSDANFTNTTAVYLTVTYQTA